ncbi:hypothetical protein MPER_07412 [Moniliophthora perniciosa FA553]|nr:hypothetical protein MPER_07412 [Moniliophthora perniciosa FA553]
MHSFKALVAFLAIFDLINAQKVGEWPFDRVTLCALDGSITASFVSFGATLTELWVKDRTGRKRDVIPEYDDNVKQTPVGSRPSRIQLVGRYANRLKNGTFSIPISKNPPPDGPNVWHIPTNDHNGQVTLHGGIYGWDRRNWTIVSRSSTSVTYQHIDDGDENWPGKVTVLATHSVLNGGIHKTEVKAEATEKTPIMVTQHIYWNLDGYIGSENVLDHHLQVDSVRVIKVDSNAIPTVNPHVAVHLDFEGIRSSSG